MTKSIEEQAVQYAYTKVSSKQNHNFHYAEQGYFNGAKARDAQWSAVVNEYKNIINSALYGTWFSSVTMRDTLKGSITKADHLLKEMGIK